MATPWNIFFAVAAPQAAMDAIVNFMEYLHRGNKAWIFMEYRLENTNSVHKVNKVSK
jgi:hypothetical protein